MIVTSAGTARITSDPNSSRPRNCGYARRPGKVMDWEPVRFRRVGEGLAFMGSAAQSCHV